MQVDHTAIATASIMKNSSVAMSLIHFTHSFWTVVCIIVNT